MNVAVLNAQVPFVRGGAELLADSLALALERAGHRSEVISLPFASRPTEAALDHLLAVKLTRISGADRIIALKYPAYCLDHPGMVLWLLHQHRVFHELWGASGTGTEDTVGGRALRDTVRRAEQSKLRDLPRYAISEVVRERLRRSTGLDATVLHPPPRENPALASAARSDASGDYIFFPGRISWLKRQSLAISAMRHTRTDVRLVIAGPVSETRTLLAIKTLIARGRLGDRVTVIDRWLSDQEQAALYTDALAVAVPAFDEEYGLVVLEAFAAGRPVVTCTDSGTPAILVEAGQSGFICAPDARSMADSFDRLRSSPDFARTLGAGARERLQSLDLSWDRVVEALLS